MTAAPRITRRFARVTRALELAAVGLALLVIVGTLAIMLARVGFPLELEWMEGGLLHQALRIQRGEPAYPPPTAAFVPFLYPPAYPALLAALGRIAPLDFALARAVSIACAIATGWAIARAVRREAKPASVALVAVGLFAGAYPFTLRWLDLARPDALFLALATWGLVLLREGWGDRRRIVLAGLCMGLAFWAKQTAFVLIVASGLGALIVAPRGLALYVLVVAAVDLGGLAIGQLRSGGMLWHYIFELHQAHGFNAERFRSKAWLMLLHAWPWLVAVGATQAVAAVRAWWRWRGERSAMQRDAAALWARLQPWRGVAYWTVMLAAALLVSALGYATQWAEPNAFLPGVAIGAIWIGVVLPPTALGFALVGAQLLQAALVEPRYQPIQDAGLAGVADSYTWRRWDREVPTAQAWRAAAAQRERLATRDGAVFALHRPWWSVIAGGSGHVGAMGVRDVAPQEGRRIQGELRDRLREGRDDVLYMEGDPPLWLRSALAGRYTVIERRTGDARVLPWTGWMSEAGMVTPYTREQLVFAATRPRPLPAGARVVADFEDGTLQGFERSGPAFGGRAVDASGGSLPPWGLVGGTRLLSSAGPRDDRSLRGELLSPAIDLPREPARLELWIGRSSVTADVRADVVELDGTGSHTLPLRAAPWMLEAVSWPVPPELRGRRVQLRVRDDDPNEVVALDDVVVVPGDG